MLTLISFGGGMIIALPDIARNRFSASGEAVISLMYIPIFVSMHLAILFMYALSKKSKAIAGKLHRYIESLTIISLFMLLIALLGILYFSTLFHYNIIFTIYVVMSFFTVILFCIFVMHEIKYLFRGEKTRHEG